MSSISEKLARALQSLPFVQVIQHDQQGTAVNVMCRVNPDNMEEWADLAREILLRGRDSGGQWNAHIARTYVLKGDDLRYAWNFIIMGRSEEGAGSSINEDVLPVLRQRAAIKPVPAEDTYEEEAEEEAAPPPTPRRRNATPPEADERGNPIVPEEYKVESIQMAGLPRNYERNMPDPEKGKGAWKVEGRSGNFRPPVKR